MWEPIITFSLLSICLIIFFIRHIHLPIYCKYISIITISHFIFYAFTAFLMFNKINNMILFHVLRPLQYTLTCFYLIEVFSNGLIKKALIFSVPLYILLSLFFSFKVQTILEYNSYGILTYNFLVIIWILLFFKELLVNAYVDNLLIYPAFWISIGLLFYCVGTSFSEGLMNYLINHHRIYALSFYYIGIILSFFLYCFIIISFICDKIFKKKHTFE